MPDQKATTRDRELTNRALDNSPLTISQERYLILRDQVEAVVAEARREGREEVQELRNIAIAAVNWKEAHDRYRESGARGDRIRETEARDHLWWLAELANKPDPAPPGAKEQP